MNLRRHLTSRLEVAKGASRLHLRAWNLLSLGAFSLQRRILPRLELGYPVFGSVGGVDVKLCVRSPADVSVFWEVFAEGEYRDLQVHDPRVILDVGANVGFAAVYFATRFPNAVVHSLEPDPKNFELLRRNVAGYPSIRTHQVALAASVGPLELYVNPSSGVSSSIAARPGSSPVQVQALTLDAFLDRERLPSVDLLKFDIEGAEYEVFRAPGALDRVKSLVGEFHGDLVTEGWTKFSELFSGYDVESRALSETRRLMRAVRRDSLA